MFKSLLIGVLTLSCALVLADQPTTKPVAEALNFKMKDIDGKEVELSKYAGKVVMIVNVASKCGNTPQYAELEKLHELYAEKGLAILGFPCNDFGGQEPGTDEEIKTFCTQKYNVKFDMFSKIAVKGDEKAPLYAYLTSDKATATPGDIKWNFEKFLISKEGKVVARFGPRIKPSTEEIIKAIETELSK